MISNPNDTGDGVSTINEKTCIKCGETKPLEEFVKNKTCKYGRESTCKECARIRRKARYQQNRHKEQDCARAYGQANKHRRAEYNRTYKKANKESISEYNRAYKKANKESISEYNRAYNQTESGKKAKRNHNRARRARKANAPGFYDWDAMMEIYDHKCALCGDSDVPVTEGHIIPLDRGGSNWAFNIRPECQSCNSSKRARLDEELSADWWADRPDGSEWPTQI